MKYEEKARKIVEQLTLEEKALLCAGRDFWHLRSIDRFGLKPVTVSDGPHGLRKQNESDGISGNNESIQAVCFPAACATASSFDCELMRELGSALGEECRAESVSILLGPAINIKRNPLCGRNFEYFSEDPCLAGNLAASYIEGVQNWNVGTSLKHFAANNQETRRMTVSSNVDERTLREIYLTAFETAVKKADPWTVMCSYNRINGVYASQNKRLLSDILRGEWGFSGAVMSDWGAVNDRVEALKAGLDLEMPGPGKDTCAELVAAVRESRLDAGKLDRSAARIIALELRCADSSGSAHFDYERHHALAVKFEEESAVLLQNRGNLLPLTPGKRIALIGPFAKAPRYQGGGSSHINPYHVTSALEAVKGTEGISYAPGFSLSGSTKDSVLSHEAIELAKEADTAVIFAGLPDSYESEGYDRKDLRLPENQNALIRAICSVQPHTVVVLHNGSPVEMPWANEVPSILELYLGGEGVGEAAIDLLFGRANPSGRLPESFPLRLEDNPSYLNFPGENSDVDYREGIFVGYRYYDTKKAAVRFPFGHGLSYTTFRYSNLRVDRQEISDSDTLTVQVDVTNIGKRAGKEVVQLYIRDKTGSAFRPDKELKGFCKLMLKPGETKTASFHLGKRAFAWYNTKLPGWFCGSGIYEILIGRSSRSIELSCEIRMNSSDRVPLRIDRNTTLGDLLADPRTKPALEKKLGPIMASFGNGADTDAAVSPEMMIRMIKDTPLRSACSFGVLREKELDGLISELRKLL